MLNSDEYDSSATARANARAWNVEVANNHWATVPLTDDEFRAAAQNGFPVSLTGSRPVPASGFGDLSGRHFREQCGRALTPGHDAAAR